MIKLGYQERVLAIKIEKEGDLLFRKHDCDCYKFKEHAVAKTVIP